MHPRKFQHSTPAPRGTLFFLSFLLTSLLLCPDPPFVASRYLLITRTHTRFFSSPLQGIARTPSILHSTYNFHGNFGLQAFFNYTRGRVRYIVDIYNNIEVPQLSTPAPRGIFFFSFTHYSDYIFILLQDSSWCTMFIGLYTIVCLF